MTSPYSSPRSSQKSIWNQPKKLALIIGVVMGVWILSAILIPPSREAEKAPEIEVASTEEADSKAGESAETNTPKELSKLPIKFEAMKAQKRARTVTLNGVTEPERVTLVQAETEGKVERIAVREGQLAKKGDLLMKLDVRDRKNKVDEAHAILKQRKVELNAAKKLYKQGFQSKVRFTQAEAAVASARSQLKRAQLDLKYTDVRAPYTGVVEEILVEEGDLVGRGFATQTVLRFVDLSPLKITGQISEMERLKIKTGDDAAIRLAGQQEITGKIGYVATVADKETRTFKVEIEVPNPERKLQAGVSAEISLKSDEQLVYEVPSSVLSIDDAGNVGVKLVSDEKRVQFQQVEVLSQSEKGVWISGLADQVVMVTEGVAFVADGQLLELPEEKKPTAMASDQKDEPEQAEVETQPSDKDDEPKT